MDGNNSEIRCKKGEIIFNEGDTGACMYKVICGSAAVWAHYGAANARLLTALHVGDYFGEMAILELYPRSTTVIAAEEDTRLQVIAADGLDAYLRANAGEVGAVAKHLSHRLRDLTWDYIEVCDTLRELGRQTVSGDPLSRGLLSRVEKFSRLYLAGGKHAEKTANAVPEPAGEKHGEGFSKWTQVYDRGDVIFHERGESGCMYDVHKGRVGVYTGYGTKKQKLIAELTADTFFSELGLFEGFHRAATVTALENGTCVEAMCREDLAELYEKNPAKILALLRHMSGQLKRLTRDYAKACATLAEAERKIRAAQGFMTPEVLAQIDAVKERLVAPELLY